MKLGLALGGGGARGIAHIGVLKVFQREDIPIHCITGISMGALIGGAYVYFQDVYDVEKYLEEVISDPDFRKIGDEIFNEFSVELPSFHFGHLLSAIKLRFSIIRSFRRISLISPEQVEKFFKPFMKIRIEDLTPHFSALATDLISGDEIVLEKGSLGKAMMASAALPGIFPPIKWDDYLLIDGSASGSVPVPVVKARGADKVVAVDVTKCVHKVGPLDNTLQILYRADEIVSFKLTEERLREADLIIRPTVRKIHWANFKIYRELIRKGEMAAEKVLPELEKWMK